MTKLVLKWALNSFALFIVMKLIPGIQIDRFQDLIKIATQRNRVRIFYSKPHQ